MTLLREPLLHFAVVGAVVFGAYSWLSDERAAVDAVEPVRIGEGDLRWLKQTFSSQWLREPKDDELYGLVNELANEKLLAREAKELGLEQDDTIIRRRLAQKLTFLVEDTARLAEPTEAELVQFYNANAGRFEAQGTVAFQQLYFNPEQRTDAAADAVEALARLQAKGDSEAATGDRLLLGDSFASVNELAVSAMFGAEFAKEVFALAPGEWQGPFESGYGLHLVFVTQRTPAEPRPFEDVRNAVLTEWRTEKQGELTRAYLTELRKKHGLEIDDGVKAVWGTPAPEVAAR